MIQRLSILVTVAAVIAVSSVPAGAQTCPFSFCNGTYLDFQKGSSDGNFTAPSNCDACPGHCVNDPTLPCVVDSSCNSVGGACSFSGNYGHCTNAGKLGRACNGNNNCYVSAQETGTCADYTTPFAGDGVCTISYNNTSTSVAYTVTGTSGIDLMCVGSSGGNMTVNASGAADTVLATHSSGTFTINGGDGNDYLSGGAGVDVIDGGNGDNDILGNGGNDTLIGGSGDDEILGGDGNDTIIGQGGRDVMIGGAGDDTIFTSYLVTPANDVLGSILCGGAGNDILYGNGPGHQCMDGGTDQAPTGGAPVDCGYLNTPADSDDHDIGTAINCKNPSGTSSTRHPSCACD